MTELNNSTFNDAIASDSLTLVDFWASWCGPCKMLAPIVQEVATELGSRANVAKVNVDDSPDLASQYGVASIPTLVLFRNGKEIDRSVGFLPKEALLEFVQKHE